MSNLLSELKTIGDTKSIRKQQKIMNGLLSCIESGQYKIGDILPSVNDLSNNLGYA